MPPHKNTIIHIGSDGGLEPGLWGGGGHCQRGGAGDEDEMKGVDVGGYAGV